MTMDVHALPGIQYICGAGSERTGQPYRPPASAVLGAVPPPGLLLLSIMAIQVGAALAIQLFPALGPSGTVALRVGFSALFLLAASRPRFIPDLLRYSGWIVIFGLVIATMNLFFYQAIARIPLGAAVTVEFVGPLGLAAITSRRWVDLVWVLLAAIGISLFSPIGGEPLDLLGLVFALLAGVCWAGFVLVSARVGRQLPGGQGLALAMTVAAIALLPFAVPIGAEVLSKPALLLGAVVVALLSTTIPYRLEYEALQRLSPSAYGVLVSLEPAVATLVGAVLLSERIGARSTLAVMCVTIAAIGTTVFARPGRKG